MKNKIGMAMRKAGVLALAFSVFAASVVLIPQDVGAHLTATVEGSLRHADDCECKAANLGNNWYIPGSIHKFNLEFSTDVSNIIDLEYEYRSEDSSVLIKSDGFSAWYQINRRTDNQSVHPNVAYSYTGYKKNGVVYDEIDGGIASSCILEIEDDFYVVSSSCNPPITIKGNTSQQLKVYAQHFTLSDPYGSSVEDVTSWIDWSQVDKSGTSIEVSNTGLLTAPNTKRGGEFTIGIYNKALKLPAGVLLTVTGPSALRGNVIPNSSDSQGNQNTDENKNNTNGSGNKNNNKNVTVPRPVITALKNVKGKKLTVKWKKVKGATGYQIQYTTDKKFKKGIKSKELKKNNITLAKLSKNKKYYVRVRAYQKVSGVTYQSKWSKVKNKSVKK